MEAGITVNLNLKHVYKRRFFKTILGTYRRKFPKGGCKGQIFVRKVNQRKQNFSLVGRIYMFTSRHSNAEATIPSRGGMVSLS
jgi:hypothetical protein